MKSSRLKRRIGWWIPVCLIMANLSHSQIAGGQLRSVPASVAPTQAQSPDVSQDPLGRSTPRGTVLGFFSAAYDHKYEIAAQYLNTRQRGNESAELAKQLFFVLDRRLPAKLNNLSSDPLGSMSDPLDMRRELVGTVASSEGKVDIYVERVDRPNAQPIWLFSRQTLINIPDLYDEVRSVSAELLLPEFLLRKYFGVNLFGWLFFLGIPILYLILSVVNRLLGAAAGYVLRHWARRPLMSNPKIISHPYRLLIVSGCVFAAISQISLSLAARQVGSIIGTMILIAALVWIMILINGKCEAYFRRRLERQGLLGSTAMLRPARRVVDLIYIVVGLMFALHSFGINPSAALAGLGIGGIAVALAAQKTLENVIGGASLIMDEAVRLGDFFKMGDVVGTVEAIGLRSTRVRTLDRTLVTIPNGQMATMTLENYSARDQFWLHHLVGLGYQAPPSSLNSVLDEVRVLLEQDPRVLPATSRVRLLRFAESGLELEVFAYVSARDWSHFLEIQEELLIKIREVITSADLEIAYPTHSVYLKNEIALHGAAAEQPLHSTGVAGTHNP